jgi:hypothetical protein
MTWVETTIRPASSEQAPATSEARPRAERASDEVTSMRRDRV